MLHNEPSWFIRLGAAVSSCLEWALRSTFTLDSAWALLAELFSVATLPSGNRLLPPMADLDVLRVILNAAEGFPTLRIPELDLSGPIPPSALGCALDPLAAALFNVACLRHLEPGAPRDDVAARQSVACVDAIRTLWAAGVPLDLAARSLQRAVPEVFDRADPPRDLSGSSSGTTTSA